MAADPTLTENIYEMADIAERLAVQAYACGMMGSPFMATLIQAAESDYREGGQIRDLLDSYPSYPRPGLNLAAALHYLALNGEPALSKHYPSVGGDGDGRAAWSAGRAILAEHRDLIEHLFAGVVQTNEPARSMPILAAALSLAAHFNLPVRAFEIGASAGLNLRFDHSDTKSLIGPGATPVAHCFFATAQKKDGRNISMRIST
jgi:hypothetical protein